MLDRSIRDLERERMQIEGQVKKTMAEMKKMAKAGQEVPSQIAQRSEQEYFPCVGCGQVDGERCS